MMTAGSVRMSRWRRIAGSIGAPVAPDPSDVEGFNAFYARHRKGLAIERAAVEALD